MRNEAERLLDAVEEALRIGREAGLPVQISHHKAAGRANWGKTAQSIAYIEEQCKRGMDITFDVYPYTAGSTSRAGGGGVEEATELETVMSPGLSLDPDEDF